MKVFKYFVTVFILTALSGLFGCYTMVSMRDNPNAGGYDRGYGRYDKNDDKDRYSDYNDEDTSYVDSTYDSGYADDYYYDDNY
jgi:hypothetical protein